ncbi:MAG: ABC transporter ATP-binding protein [Bdellovibrionota bacterium]
MALIELKDIKKTFVMGHETIHALDGVSFSVGEGELVSIVGPSGSGKSTLMNILGLLDTPDAGSYHLDGRPVQTLTDDERSMLRNQKIGFVFQSFNLLARASALRNVEMPLVYSASYDKHFSKQKIRDMAVQSLTQVGLQDRMDHKPNELSGGQRQRVAIARALVNRPKILFADEPTGNLDSKSGTEILKLFHDLHNQGVTVIIVTHDPKVAANAKRVISVLDGKISSDKNADQ